MNPDEDYTYEERWEYEQYIEEMERAYDEARDELLIDGLENTIKIGGE